MKKLLLGLGILPFVLASCSLFGSPSFFEKNFVLNGHFNNLDDKLQGGSTNRKDLTDNFANIDWDDQRGTKFTDHSSVSSVIKEMDSTATTALKSEFGDYVFSIGKESEKKATVSLRGQVTQFTVAFHGGDETALDLNDSQGYNEYTLWNMKSSGTTFERVGIMFGSNFASVNFVFIYKTAIAGIEGIKVTYYANFLPQSK